MRFGLAMLQAFSPSLAADAQRKAEHDAAELDEIEKGRSRSARYLVAWLPWLSLLKYFRNDIKHMTEKTVLIPITKGVEPPSRKRSQVVLESEQST